MKRREPPVFERELRDERAEPADRTFLDGYERLLLVRQIDNDSSAIVPAPRAEKRPPEIE